jgi:acyl-[acyl carrier protein]--UDP-N-acetylglucosamine O-acyltransferase
MIRALKNVRIGKNNYISPTAILHDNVTIGDNNNIYDNVIIYPNTKIGNNNNIFPRNIIGELPISSNDKYNSYDFNLTKGVIIGNNNLFHVSNIIFSGIDNETFIGNNNKFLAENHIAHDVKVFNNVTFYPRCIPGGYSIYLDNSNIGMNAVIHQKIVVGQYSMIGANNTIVKNVFPYYININNKLHRLNEQKIPKYIKEYDTTLKEINENYIVKKYDTSKFNLSQEIDDILCEYLKNIIFMK